MIIRTCVFLRNTPGPELLLSDLVILLLLHKVKTQSTKNGNYFLPLDNNPGRPSMDILVRS